MRRRVTPLLIGHVFGTRTVVGVVHLDGRNLLRVRCACGEEQTIGIHQARKHDRRFHCAMLLLHGSAYTPR